MENFVEEVLDVSDWALVRLKPECNLRARQLLTLKQEAQGNKEGATLHQYRTISGDQTKLYIPRALVSHLPLMMDGTWAKLNHTIKSKLVDPREGQTETIEKFIGALDTFKYGGILQAVTGAGKTVMALDIACRLGLRVLIVVPRTSLMKQWKDQILKWTTAKESDIGVIQGPNSRWQGAMFTIAMIHTLAQKGGELSKELRSYFGTVIYDECHVVGAETFSTVAPLFFSRWRIGLSATPRRSDGMDPVFYWHIGPIIARYTKLQAVARVRIIPYNGTDTSHSGCVWSGNLNLGRYFNRVARSSPRFNLVRALIETLHEKEHHILMLAERLEYIDSMKRALILADIPEDDIGVLTGKVKQTTKRIILGTYGSAGMGVDIPRLSALVLASPRADIEQAIGRVLRQGNPIVVDIVDTASSIMMGWSLSRKKFYRKITVDIVDKTGR